jgi:hypothetical protein
MLLLGKVVSWFCEEDDDDFSFKPRFGIIIDTFNDADVYYFLIANVINDYIEMYVVESSLLSDIILDEYTAKKKLDSAIDKLQPLMRY